MMHSVVIQTCSADELLAKLGADPFNGATMVHADPPWSYSNTGTNGAAQQNYDGLPMSEICETLARSARVADGSAYLAVWCVFPLLVPFILSFNESCAYEAMRGGGRGWEALSGGGLWHKDVDGKLGVGFHFRGQVEVLLLYRVGKPKPVEVGGNSWGAPRQAHSEKPQLALDTLCKMLEEQTLVVDLYAGETASMARACHRAGLHYVGAELDPERADKARARLKQGDLFHGYPQEAIPGT